MAEKFDTSWFDLKNYEVLKTMSIEDWASVLESRSYCEREYGYFDNQNLDYADQEDFDWARQEMANELKSGYFSVDGFVEAYIEDPDEPRHSFSTSTVDSLANYQAWDMAEYGQDSRKLRAFQKMRDEWLRPLGDDEDGSHRLGLQEVAHAPYDFHFKQYLNMNHIPSSAHVVVNLDAPNEQIKNDFNHWLMSYRKASGYHVQKKKAHEKLFNQKTFNYWIKYGLIPYLDLVLVAKLEGKTITQKKCGELIFPDEFDVDTEERIKTITKPEAERLMEDSTRWSLLRQAAAGSRKKTTCQSLRK